MLQLSLLLLFILAIVALSGGGVAVSGLSTSKPTTTQSHYNHYYYLVTGANKGQGLALCQRILREHDDTHVILCSRDLPRGKVAAQEQLAEFVNDDTHPNNSKRRVDVIQLDVTDEASIAAAVLEVQEILGDTNKLHGFVSNAGILWGYPLEELLDVCATGVKCVLDAFLPLMDSTQGRMVVVSSGLGPLMHQYSSPDHQRILKTAEGWDELKELMDKCLEYSNHKKDDEDWDSIGFSGGPFEESAPDFHMYGLAKMFADAYLCTLARANPNLAINACDPGLVYTDLIGTMPRYAGKAIEETTAKTPAQGVEAAMRLLFGTDIQGSGQLYAINKEGVLMGSAVDKRPDV